MTRVRLLSRDVVSVEQAHGRPLKVPLPLKDPYRQIEGYCPRCERTGLPAEDFQWFTRRNTGVKRRQSACKQCARESKKSGQKVSPAIRMKEWAKLYPEAYEINRYVRSLRRFYKLSLVRFLNMLHQQDYKCARCRSSNWIAAKPTVDHDHVTGRVRGLLCSRCNQILGHLGDTVVSVRSELGSYLGYLEGRL